MSFNIHSQHLAIGQWSEHLPYIHARTLADGGDKIFCATDDGLFAYHKDDNSLQRFSKLSGLNDFGVATIEYSMDYKTLIIAYTNSNIDLVKDDGGVFNLSDIKRKNIPGNKEINNIRVNGRFAFLSCGFGIVVIDLLKQEIKDTYHVNVDSINNNVYEVVSDANWYYAATDSGIYRALVNDPNLNSYFEWSKVFTQSGYGHFSFIESYSNLIIANFMITDVSGNYQSDAIFSSADGITWVTNVPPLSGNGRNYSFRVSNNLLIVTDRQGKFKEAYPLDPAVYKQPEGITFTPTGDMIISNEWHETGLATILVIKNKKKGL